MDNIQKIECIDCKRITDDYYSVSTNKGNIYKCTECYELSVSRDTRLNNKPYMQGSCIQQSPNI